MWDSREYRFRHIVESDLAQAIPVLNDIVPQTVALLEEINMENPESEESQDEDVETPPGTKENMLARIDFR